MSNTTNDEKNLGHVGQAALYKYGWLCLAEWHDYQLRLVYQPPRGQDWRSMQQYLFF